MGSPAADPLARKAGELPFPEKAVGEPNEEMPFDHIVVVMMENHSFDNLLGALSLTDDRYKGLSFDGGEATDSNPQGDTDLPAVKSFPLQDTAQAKNVSQSWRATHEQINNGKMDGFVRSVHGASEPMGYYTPEVLPFAYSLAREFTLANNWFCSVPGPTYPNRRFLLAGTAYGGTVTGLNTLLDPPPPNGTIFDRLSHYNISWANYFTDIPMTAVIPSIVLKHLDHHHLRSKFFHDCKAGTLPAVSFVDPAMGALSSVAAAVASLPSMVKDALRLLGANFRDLPPSETEEDPDDMYPGELWAYEVLEAVLHSPCWKRTLLIYTYDEHGGYYDHVNPPDATLPDGIPPKLAPGEPTGGYDKYGPRVPAVVVSPWSRQGDVTNDVHDHTSILATIEHKWNLPALTNRDANAAHVMDFLIPDAGVLDPDKAPLLQPPSLEKPSDTGPSGPVTKTP
jgi:phospholipase C